MPCTRCHAPISSDAPVCHWYGNPVERSKGVWRRLTFDITQQPQDPEIMGHLSINRGQFILQDNGDGTTTVTGTSWYHLYVYTTAYFNCWTEDIVRHVHLRVMEHIKTLAEHNL